MRWGGGKWEGAGVGVVRAWEGVFWRGGFRLGGFDGDGWGFARFGCWIIDRLQMLDF